MTRPAHEVHTALYLVELGLNDCQIGRLLKVPRPTVRDWRNGKRTFKQGLGDGNCNICGHAPIDEAAYSYLLGLYLGDGCISHMKRGVYRLRIVLDYEYPGIIGDCMDAIGSIQPYKENPAGLIQCLGCIEVYSNWKHWPCLFPQHGKGPKHKRQIVLVPWQQAIVDAFPGQLLKGLIHSDGCRANNRVKGKVYPRYHFDNYSADIRKIFCDTCDTFGVRWRQSNVRTISISKSPDVAKLDSIIGPKA